MEMLMRLMFIRVSRVRWSVSSIISLGLGGNILLHYFDLWLLEDDWCHSTRALFCLWVLTSLKNYNRCQSHNCLLMSVDSALIRTSVCVYIYPPEVMSWDDVTAFLWSFITLPTWRATFIRVRTPTYALDGQLRNKNIMDICYIN